MLIALWPLVVAVVGALLFFIAKTNGDVKEVGRILFFVGAFWLVYSLTGKTLHVG